MDAVPGDVGARTLDDLCASVIHKFAFAWPPSEESLSQEFLAYFGKERLSTFDGLVSWCGEVGIAFSTNQTPNDLHGFNYSYGDARAIVMPGGRESTIFREHTLIHEIREQLEFVFCRMGHPTADRESVDSRAEQFAIITRLKTMQDLFGVFLNAAGEVKDSFGRFLAYCAIGVFGIGAIVGCVGVRQLEANLDRQR